MTPSIPLLRQPSPAALAISAHVTTPASQPSRNHRLHNLWLLCTALTLSGCISSGGLTPELRITDADTLHLHRSVTTSGLSPSNFPADDWWRTFGDQQLNTLMDEALRDGPSLAIANARLNAARAQAGLAEANRLPTLSAGARYSGLQLPGNLLPGDLGGHLQGSHVLTLEAAWSPDLWGAQRAQWEAAVGQVHAGEADAQAARLALTADVLKQYIALAQAHNNHAIAVNEHQRALTLADLTRQRVTAGLDSELQLHTAHIAIGAARQQEQAANQQIQAHRLALAALLGKGPDRGMTIAPPAMLQQPPASGVPEVLPSELLGHRPDVVAARWRVEVAARDIKVAQAAFRPNINLSALVGVVAPTLSTLFDSGSAFALAGPALSLPIFDGGRRRASLAGRNAEYDLAVANYNQRLVIALREVADALNWVHSLETQINAIETSLTSTRAAHDLARRRYQEGIGTQLEVMTAQRPLLEFQQRLSLLRAQQLTATVDLNSALGGGILLHTLPLSAPNPLAGISTP